MQWRLNPKNTILSADLHAILSDLVDIPRVNHTNQKILKPDFIPTGIIESNAQLQPSY